jgi:hypothetical protein
MKTTRLILIFTMLLMLPIIVNAAEQTQQYNKIYLNPFYQATMTANTNVTFNVTVNPPDGISTVNSAIITFNGQINGQTQTFNIWVNGGACNTPTYSVATAFSTTGNVQFSFDCSNRITKSGIYNVTLRSSVNTGAMSGSLELTYMNNPGRKLEIFGTEYQVADNGKIFVQLLENSITPINNASCYLTVYYPNNTKWYDKTLMTYQPTSNALYYFDFTAPSTTGVYMTDVYCEYYTTTQYTNATAYSLNPANGWYVSGNGTSLTRIDSDYLITVERNTNPGLSGSGITTVLQGHLDEYTGTSTEDTSPTPSTGTHNNGVLIGQGGNTITGASVRYDGVNDYTNYPAATKFNLNSSDQLMVCFNFNESTSNPNGDRIMDSLGSANEGFRISFDGGNQLRFVSDRSGSGAQTIDTTTTYLDGLWHTACMYSNLTTMTTYVDGTQVVTAAKTQSGTMNMVNGITLGAVVTGVSNFAVVGLDEVCVMKGTFSAPGTVASNYHTNKQCGTPTNTLDFNTSITGITQQPNNINYNIITTYQWDELVETVDLFLYNYTGSSWYKLPNSLSRSLTDSTVSNQFTLSATNITQFLSGGTMIIRMNDSSSTGATIGTLKLNQVRLDQIAYAQTPATQIRGGGEVHISNFASATTPATIWNYTTRTLTYTPPATVNSTEVSNAVWNNTNRTLTDYPNITNSINMTTISDSVWNATNRTLTYYPAQVDLTNYSLIAELVWSYTSRNLTYYPVQIDLTNYTLIQLMTWNATNRNLTYYPAQTDLTDYGLIQTYVWNATDRNLTYYPSVDTNAVALAVWNYTSRQLTYYPTQVDLTNYSLINSGVWSYTDRNLTYYPAQTDMTNYSQIESGVWSYTDRKLTYYPTQSDLTNYTLINDGVWNYNNRTLTYYPAQTDLTNYSAIQDYVWNATTRELTYYQVNNITPADVWTYINRTLTYYEVNNLTSSDVWTYIDRNLTFYPAQSDLTNYTAIWEYPERNLTYYAPASVNETAISDSVWNSSARYTHGVILN